MSKFGKQFLALTFVCFFLCVFSVQGQTPTQTPSANSKGSSPLGSFGGSNFDRINLFNGNLSFSIPLAALGGRNGLGAAVTLSYNSKIWRIEKMEITVEGGGGMLTTVNRAFYDETDGGIPMIAPGWVIHAGRMIGRQRIVVGKCSVNNQGGTATVETLTTFTFTAPDGTEYNFRDKNRDGEPISSSGLPCPVMPAISRGTIFETNDGTAATFISDAEVFDTFTTGELAPSGTVVLRDGTRFRISSGRVVKQTDTNGNVVRFEYEPAANGQPGINTRLTKVTDTLGRVIEITYFNRTQNSPPESELVRIETKINGVVRRTVRIVATQLGQVLRDGGFVTTERQLFNDLDLAQPDMAFNPNNIISRIELPGGFKFQFKYNLYGEVSSSITPAGGRIDYNHTPMTESNGGVFGTGTAKSIFRRVKERLVYPDGINLEGRTVYGDPAIREAAGSEFTAVLEQAFDPAGNIVAQTRHRFLGNPMDDIMGSGTPPKTGFVNWREGKEVRTVEFDVIVEPNGTRRVEERRITEFTFEQRANIPWAVNRTGSTNFQPEKNPRLTKKRVILRENGQTDLVSDVNFTYDDYNNVLTESVTDFGIGAPSATILRTTTRSYVALLNGTNYQTNNNVHLRSLVASERISGPGGPETETTFEYDNYSATANHAPLIERIFSNALADTRGGSEYGVGGITRGNVTAVTRGVGTADASTSYSQYDIAGNVVKAIGPNGQVAEMFYEATTPDGIPHFAFPTRMNQFVTQDGVLIPLTVTTAYDFATGAVTSTTGVNGEVTSFEYNDELDRLTREVRPTGLGNTLYFYSLPGSMASVEAVFQGGPFNISNRTEFDGLLRPVKQDRSDAGGLVSVLTRYDALGRAYLVSNPFRLSSPSTTDGWTRTNFDGLGRVIRVASYATESQALSQSETAGFTGKVTSEYFRNTVTVTDQAGKKRKSATDALGRLTQVDEPDANGTLNISTTYVYDARGNLKTVNQGTLLPRQFTYDALSRLKTAFTPESGTINYNYDTSSNLISRTDARTITTNFTYDELNRVRTKTYSGSGSANTQNVTFYYDNSVLPAGLTPPAPYTRGAALGRLVAVISSANARQTETGTFFGYDQVGRLVQSSQLLDGNHYQTTTAFNELSLPISEKYEPTQVITETAYNVVGQISAVTRKNGQSIQTLASNTSYGASGALEKQRLGNNLHHSINYNNRLQPISISLGTTLNGAERMNIAYSYGEVSQVNNANSTVDLTRNNGNVAKITVTPGSGATPFIQNYSYDELNRVKSTAEYVGTGATSSSWSMTFQYDRYGNKKIFDAQNQEIPISTTTNRITGAGYVYDAAGNLTQEPGNKSYEYDAENRMFRATVGTNITEYFYDGNGRRVKKVPNSMIVGTVRFIYDGGGKLIAEYQDAQAMGTPQNEYYYGATGLLATMEQDCAGKVMKYTTPDTLGSARVVTSMTGAVLSRHDYFPFGEEISAGVGGRTAAMGYSVDDKIKQKFTGYERDSETGLDFAQARYYSSGMGRFTSPDLLPGIITNPQSLNRYAYSLNSPLVFSDPSGLAPFPVVAVANATNAAVKAIDAKVKAEIELRAVAGFAEDFLKIDFLPFVDEDSGLGERFINTTGSLQDNPLTDPEAFSSGATGGVIFAAGAIKAAGPGIRAGIKSLFGKLKGLGGLFRRRPDFAALRTQRGVITGNLFERTIETTKGPVDVLAEIVVEGDSLTLKDIAIFGRGKEALSGLTREILAARTQLANEARELGFKVLKITGRRVETSTSANPGKTVNITIDLTQGSK